MKITDEQLISTLRALAAERPDYVYKAPAHMTGFKCFYVHTDSSGEPTGPGCIVGAALHRLGVPLEVLAEHEGGPARDVIASLTYGASWGLMHRVGCVQGLQDTGHCWADAVAHLQAIDSLDTP